MKGAVITGTVASLAVTAAWAWASSLTIGPAGPLHLTWRHPVASYVTLAASPSGNGWELFAVVALILAACLLVSGWRQMRRAARETPEAEG